RDHRRAVGPGHAGRPDLSGAPAQHGHRDDVRHRPRRRHPRPLPDRLAARLDRRRHGRGFRGPRRGLRRRRGVGRRAGRVPPPPLLRCGPARTPRCGERMTMSYLRIATEEAYAPAELFDLYRELLPDTDDIGFRSLMGHYLTSDAERPRFVRSRLTDLGET